jgi:hypothetical protein
MNLRRAVIKAAKEKLRQGEITRSEMLMIRLGTLRRQVLDEVGDHVFACAMAAGVLPAGADDYNDVDWSELLEIIAELIPQIMQIIQAILILF